MKAVTLMLRSVSPRTPIVLNGKEGLYFTFLHGVKKEHGSCYRLSLGFKDFPCPQDKGMANDEAGHLKEADFKLIPLRGKRDANDQNIYILGKGEKDDTQLVFLDLYHPDWSGEWEVEGKAHILAEGTLTKGVVEPIPYPVIHVTGPAEISWTLQKGDDRLRHTAIYDGKEWSFRVW